MWGDSLGFVEQYVASTSESLLASFDFVIFLSKERREKGRGMTGAELESRIHRFYSQLIDKT